MRKILIILLLAACLPGSQSHITVIKNPKANIIEKPAIPLKHVRTIPLRLASNVFNIDPISATTDENGNVYLYDKFICQIRKLDGNDNLLSTIDINSAYKSWQVKNTRRPAFEQFSKENGLYVYDPVMTTLLRYDNQGNLIERFEHVPFMDQIVVSPDGGVLIPEFIENDLVFKCLAKKTVRFRINDYKHEFLFFKQEGAKSFSKEELFQVCNYYVYFENERLLIFNQYSSRIIVIAGNGNKLLNKSLLPKEALDSYRRELSSRKKEIKDKVIPFFYNPFFDLTEQCLYVQTRIKTNDQKWRNLLYVFSNDGILKKRMTFAGFDNQYVNFMIKNDQEFLVLVSKKILCFEEKK
jgi:hypothetical protein